MSHAIQLHSQIHERVLEIARRYKRAEGELIEALEQADTHRIYHHYGHSSLFQYGVHELGLSENVIYTLITVMRKSKEVPALKTEIQSGQITLSNAKRITAVLTPENQKEWLTKASTLSQRALEKEVIKIKPILATLERASYATSSRIKLEFGLEEKEMLKLRQVQHLVSQNLQINASLEETMIELIDFYLKHKDPLIKAKRIIAKKGINPTSHATSAANPKPSDTITPTGTATNLNPSHAATIPATNTPTTSTSSQSKNPAIPNAKKHLDHHPTTRAPIPANILHHVNLRDQRECNHILTTGKKCSSKRWLEIHHIIPVSNGGKNNLENLITLCSTHHSLTHQHLNKGALNHR